MREIGFILLHLTHLNKLFIFPREEIERAKDEKNVKMMKTNFKFRREPKLLVPCCQKKDGHEHNPGVLLEMCQTNSTIKRKNR
jgi:hypothetical protein